ncbi:unnamed protein product [Urochloa humidicola]
MYELHLAVPVAGAVLCTLNTRHDAAMVSVLLKHSGAKALFVDSHFLEVGRAALKLIGESSTITLPVLLTISDDEGNPGGDLGCVDYEDLIENAPSLFDIRWPVNELDPDRAELHVRHDVASQGRGLQPPRRVPEHHDATVLSYDITAMPTYLWTVPMFHSNGGSLTWAIAAQGGTNVCLRHFTANVIFDGIARHGVAHMGGAPTVITMIAAAPAADRKPLPGPVRVMTGAAPPVPRVFLEME